MGKMKKSKRRDLDKDYMLCCGRCPLCKKRGTTLTEETVEGVMKKLGHTPRVIEKYICPVRKCDPEAVVSVTGISWNMG